MSFLKLNCKVVSIPIGSFKKFNWCTDSNVLDRYENFHLRMRIANLCSVLLKPLLLIKIWIDRIFGIWQPDVLPIIFLSHFSWILSRFATVAVQYIIHREAKETQHLHKSLQRFNDMNNFVQIKRVLYNDLLFNMFWKFKHDWLTDSKHFIASLCITPCFKSHKINKL